MSGRGNRARRPIRWRRATETGCRSAWEQRWSPRWYASLGARSFGGCAFVSIGAAGAASIVGIETNVDAFLKCLIVKEILDLKKTRFMLGDALEFLNKTEDRFDMVFCSGILYHMSDPVALIKAICNVTDKCFIWTHYYNDECGNTDGNRTKRHVNILGFDADYYELEYPQRNNRSFLGGNKNLRAWMTRDDIVACFKYFGLNNVILLGDAPLNPAGACLSFAASRNPRG